MHLDRTSNHAAAAFSILALVLGGCKTAPPAAAVPNDAIMTTQVQSRLAADPNLTGQTVQATVSGAVVTLNGTVTSNAARSAASGDAGQIAGVKTVLNNLVVQAPPASAAVMAPPPLPIPTEKTRKPATILPSRKLPVQSAPIVRNAPQAAPVASEQAAPQTLPPPPPLAPVPVARNITLPAGTSLPVRITQTLDSATTQPGDKFTGAVASDIVVDGVVVLAQGTPVTGHVDAVQDAAHFKGSSLLTISLTSVSRRGERIDLTTEPYTKQGEGRGKNTAEKVGGGAAVGAILGGIFGGGKGAAIGAAAGGGLGAGDQALTRGKQVQIPTETVLRFKLTSPVLVRVLTQPGGSNENGPGLEHR